MYNFSIFSSSSLSIFIFFLSLSSILPLTKQFSSCSNGETIDFLSCNFFVFSYKKRKKISVFSPCNCVVFSCLMLWLLWIWCEETCMRLMCYFFYFTFWSFIDASVSDTSKYFIAKTNKLSNIYFYFPLIIFFSNRKYVLLKFYSDNYFY